MAAKTIPILPCRSIDENLDFYRALGFAVTFQQQRPNPYAVVERGDITLHFFSIKAYDPAQSYSTCYISTTDVDALYDAFRNGLRVALGTLPTRGLPRIGPLKDTSYGVRQFLVTDPGGNTLRSASPSPTTSPTRRRPKRGLPRPCTPRRCWGTPRATTSRPPRCWTAPSHPMLPGRRVSTSGRSCCAPT
jgi:catechol 2,3-dioxygenase-like lactoylglutathione lyase family enzyme